MSILVTGGAGFIGSHLVRSLLISGHVVSVIDNLSGGAPLNVPKGAKLYEIDLADGPRVSRVLAASRPEVVFHLAAQVSVRRSMESPEEDARSNIIGGIHVLKASLRSSVRRVVVASSGGAVYGTAQRRRWVESDPPRPTSPYGVSKYALEHYVRYFSTPTHTSVILRLANVYGPGQSVRGEAGVVALFLSAMLSGERPLIYGDGNQTRDFVWVDDVVEAFLAALDGPAGIYNIGTGIRTSVNALCGKLSRLTGFKKAPRYLEPVVGEVRNNSLDSTLASHELGWQFSVPLDKGLERLVELGSAAGSSSQDWKLHDDAGSRRPGPREHRRTAARRR